MNETILGINLQADVNLRHLWTFGTSIYFKHFNAGQLRDITYYTFKDIDENWSSWRQKSSLRRHKLIAIHKSLMETHWSCLKILLRCSP